MTTTTAGSTDGLLPPSAHKVMKGPMNHCSMRLMGRYGIPDLKEAKRIYWKHNRQFYSGSGVKLLYEAIDGCYVFQVVCEGRAYYAVRRLADEGPDNLYITVTYLSAAQALWNIVNLMDGPFLRVADATDDDSWLD